MTDLDIAKTCAEALCPNDWACDGDTLWTVAHGRFHPLTNPGQNAECLWWLLERGQADIGFGRLSYWSRKTNATHDYDFTTREQFMRAVCLAVVAVKEAGNG